ncbi:MAG TPA: hypothetical protein ENI48_06125 [Thioploca sp.]|nr:hypothetical protein [Thioploca sp.]
MIELMASDEVIDCAYLPNLNRIKFVFGKACTEVNRQGLPRTTIEYYTAKTRLNRPFYLSEEEETPQHTESVVNTPCSCSYTSRHMCR